jgi:hypothetical protein
LQAKDGVMCNVNFPRFWADFIRALKKQDIKGYVLHWHVVHVRHYIKAHKGLSLGAHLPDHVEAYLEQVSRRPRMKDWQYQQVVRSLQILFVDIVQVEWAKHYAWQNGADEVLDLPVHHGQ